MVGRGKGILVSFYSSDGRDDGSHGVVWRSGVCSVYHSPLVSVKSRCTVCQKLGSQELREEEKARAVLRKATITFILWDVRTRFWPTWALPSRLERSEPFQRSGSSNCESLSSFYFHLSSPRAFCSGVLANDLASNHAWYGTDNSLNLPLLQKASILLRHSYHLIPCVCLHWPANNLCSCRRR